MNAKEVISRYALDIEDLERQKARRKAEMILSLSKDKGWMESDFIRWFYWETDFSLDILSEASGVRTHKIQSMVGAAYPVPYKCHKCKETRYHMCNSRLEKNTFLSPKNLKHYLCEVCEKAKIKEDDEKRIKKIQANEAKARDKGRFLHEMPYDEFLETDYWKKFSHERKRDADYKCTKCGRRDLNLHTHHLKYERRGYERKTDVVVLCEACHKEAHGMEIPQYMIRNPVSLRDRVLQVIGK